MRIILTLICGLIITHLSAQDAKLSLTSTTRDTSEVSTKAKPMIVLTYKTKTLQTSSLFDIESLNPDWIDEILVIKGNSATAVYGDAGKNGVIILQLDESEEIEAYFDAEVERHRDLTEVNLLQDASNTDFQGEKMRQSVPQGIFKSSDDKNNLSPDKFPLVIIKLVDEELRLEDNQFIDYFRPDMFKLTEVIKEEKRLEELDAIGKPGVIILTLNTNEETKQAFEKLQKEIKKN